jgi:hypothetical protein
MRTDVAGKEQDAIGLKDVLADGAPGERGGASVVFCALAPFFKKTINTRTHNAVKS